MLEGDFIGQQNETCGVRSVSRHREALAGGGSFARQGGLIAVVVELTVVQLVPIFDHGGSTKMTFGP